MSWGTQFEYSIYLKGKTLKTKQDVESEIEDVKSSIAYYEMQLAIISAMNINVKENFSIEDAVFQVSSTLKDVLEGYADNITLLHDLSRLLFHIECGGEVIVE